MTPEQLESLLQGAQETDSIEFKGQMPWDKNALVKDILAMANVVDGGYIIIGIEDGNAVRLGVSQQLIDTYNIDTMRDQIEPFADPRVVFTRNIVSDRLDNTYVVITVLPFDEFPVICKKSGVDVQRGDIYFRSRARRPSSERVSRSDDMREILEASISRRSKNLRRVGLLPEVSDHQYDVELGGL